MWGHRMSFGIFKSSKDPEAAMSLIAHMLDPAGDGAVMRTLGQFGDGNVQGARRVQGLLQQERE